MRIIPFGVVLTPSNPAGFLKGVPGMKFQVYVELVKVTGSDQDDETLIDLFCGTLGRENGARKPLRLTFRDDDEKVVSTYEVKSVDDRP